MVNVNKGFFFLKRCSVNFRHFRVFVFATEHIQKLGTTGNFHKLIFRGIKSIYLIWNIFLSISLKILLKIIKENLTLKLESWFCDNKKVAFLAVFYGIFLFKKFTVDFRCFRVFVFYHRAYSKAQRKILISSFFEILRLFTWFQAFSWAFFYCCSLWRNSQSCSKLSKSTYHWSLKVAFIVIKTKMVLDKKLVAF